MKRIEKLIQDGKFGIIPPFKGATVKAQAFLIDDSWINKSKDEIKEYLLEEIPETYRLTTLEYELIKFWISKEYEWITRDAGEELYLHCYKPYKSDSCWESDDYTYDTISVFDDLFKFVKWSDVEPTSLQDILDNCEVID